jgi:dinuclear metal center YbgI/SA1388 family protein
MPTIGQVVEILDLFAPAKLAEDWDNVGLLVGKTNWSANKVMTCLTVTPTTADEAVSQGVNLIVSHHPLPFHPLRTITDESTTGRLLLQLITNGIGVYSPHTAFDSAEAGINQHLAIGLGLQGIKPLIPVTTGFTESTEFTESTRAAVRPTEASQAKSAHTPPLAKGHSHSDNATDIIVTGNIESGSVSSNSVNSNSVNSNNVNTGGGRRGWLGESLSLIEMADRVKTFLDISTIQVAGAEDLQVSRVAIACGSGGSFLQPTIAQECDCLVTGEASFHTCLEAEACGIGLILPGHFASERFALVALADYLSEQLAGIEVWASRTERDPLRTV